MRKLLTGLSLALMSSLFILAPSTAAADTYYPPTDDPIVYQLAENTFEVPLKEVHKGAAAGDFANGEECPVELGTNQVAWHFVVPAFPTGPSGKYPDGTPDLIDVQATFDPDVTPDDSFVAQSGKGWYIVTTGTFELVDATGTAQPAPFEEDVIMNLSHTCIGEVPSPSPTSSPTPTQTNSPSPSASPSPSSTPTPSESPRVSPSPSTTPEPTPTESNSVIVSGGELAQTGPVPAGILLGIAFGAITLGAVIRKLV